jgi:putative glycerol-1-phosphate prenyltransferase
LKLRSDNIFQKIQSQKGQIAVLIDPEKTNTEYQIVELVKKASFAQIDFFFVGGSTVSRIDLEKTVKLLKTHSKIPVVLFPGGSHQLSEKADALLYLSLVSGRNPDFLITHHVNSAQEIANMNIELIPTGYILVDGGTKSSVAYISQTTPIPRSQKSIAQNTALAAIFQGKKLIYFDAGSGANEIVPIEFVKQLRNEMEVPIIVGGGIRTIQDIETFKKSGVNVVVIGNHIEENIEFLLDIQRYKLSISK